MKKLYIGLMSGTSMDAVDAALVDFSDATPQLVATHKAHLSPELRGELNQLCASDSPKITQLAELDVKMAHAFADAAKALLVKTSFSEKDVLAIGSHGQTVFHYPQSPYPFSMQIGDPNTIAEKTGITTIADFRRRDIAAGGQGAPLTPAFHNFMFRSEKEDRIVLNLGGIANITYLPANAKSPIVGFDTGPANLLLDKWIYEHQRQWFDEDGNWAASTSFDDKLLQQFLSDPYFHLAPPKSTGHDYFNLNWLKSQLTQGKKSLSPATVQATLCELTAASIGMAIQQLNSEQGSILLCGGGSNNSYLKKRLESHCPKHQLYPCDDLQFPAEWIEAMAFAWFAKQTLEGKTSNLPEVTGARNPTVLGGIYLKA
ncbi:anhydro-N-acetylmuramic acid kinase [Rickettsiella endosymbiont of Dermanyssus gallinae]|uniref:anhydro-N-acetylmuramic acid kinase n=1 Tax=Rickettsiella endosymbiont of Dermanyssus gallinae TaxID=2856608 RepID=UPI001C534042|nr:anhydro-N-acetylmuramic acid kinase [Rickettsiella endosymbiont of Dermanyssus gallinae]